MKKHKTAADELAEIAGQENLGMPPALWAYCFGMEHVERNTGPGYPVLTPSQKYTLRAAAEATFMRTLEAKADTLPLLQAPSLEPWPHPLELPPRWREGLFMRKTDLRTWAKEHAPQWLGSALLAEPAPESVPANPADEWRHASAARKREIAALAVEQCGSQAKAAKSLGITRQRLATVLRNSDATVAPKSILSSWKPHKT
jgi:hypothetical protein